MRPRQKLRSTGLSTPPPDPTYKPEVSEIAADRKMEHALKAAFTIGNKTTLTRALTESVFVSDGA